MCGNYLNKDLMGELGTSSGTFMMVMNIKDSAVLSSTPANVSLLCSTDGVAIFKSSKFSLWPVWVVINDYHLLKGTLYSDFILLFNVMFF